MAHLRLVSFTDRILIERYLPGSIPGLFRIFDIYGNQLGPQTRCACLNIVAVKMLNFSPPSDKDSDVSRTGATGRMQWRNTINLMLDGVDTPCTNYLDVFAK